MVSTKISNLKKMLRESYDQINKLQKYVTILQKSNKKLQLDLDKTNKENENKVLLNWVRYDGTNAKLNTMYLITWPKMSNPIIAYYTICMHENIPEYNTPQFLMNGLPLYDQYNENKPIYIIPLVDVLPMEHRKQYCL